MKKIFAQPSSAVPILSTIDHFEIGYGDPKLGPNISPKGEWFKKNSASRTD